MSLHFRLPTLAASLLLATALPAQSPPPSQPTAITEVRLLDDVDAPLVSILIENGRIVRILQAGEELPPGLIIVDGGGGLALPAFVDAYTTTGIATPKPTETRDAMSSLVGNVHIGMREADRKGLQPSLRGVQHFALDDKGREKYRAFGFGAMHSSPSGQVLGGQSVVVALGSQALRDRVLATDVFQAADLRASGSGYPGTLMGYLAHLRQFMLDARRHSLRLQRIAEGKPDRRPPFDADLDAIGRVLNGEQALLCHADSATDILRWLKFAKVRDVKVIIAGGREAWRVSEQLLSARVPILLGLDWGDEVDDPDAQEEAKPKDSDEPQTDGDSKAEQPNEPLAEDPAAEQEVASAEQEGAGEAGETAKAKDSEEPSAQDEPDWIYEEPIEIRRERRRIWEERRDCALRLNEAGVSFAFGTVQQSPKGLIQNLRTLVELGLPKDVALGGLTTTPANLLGTASSMGKIEPGFMANIAIWSESPWAKKAELRFLVIDGERFEFEAEKEAEAGAPQEGLELGGDWQLVYSDSEGAPSALSLTMEKDGTLEGTLTMQRPGGEESEVDLNGQVSGTHVTLKGSIDRGNFSAEIRIEGDVDDDTFSGDTLWKFSGGEASHPFKATRKPGQHMSSQRHGAEVSEKGEVR